MRQVLRALATKEAGSKYPEAACILFLLLILLLCLLLWEVFPPLFLIVTLFVIWTLWLKNEMRERCDAEEALRKSEERLKAAMEKAEAANRAKSEFLSSMSHELRTPLNAILGYTQILTAQSGLAGTYKDQIEIIGTSAQHLMTLINDILDLSRIEAGKQELYREVFSLPELVQKVLNINRIRTMEKDLFFFHEEMTPLPEAVWGDERKVAQVLLNLLNNAVKYTKVGSVTFKSGYREAEDTFFCLVEDTGIGIPQERINEIFEPFSQVRNGSGFVEGTGLGLAITQRLVRLMDAELVVESEEGKGSSFGISFRLPRAAEQKAVEVQKGPPVIGYKGPRRRILAVDDNYANLSFLISMFDPLGFTVDAAENGPKALEMAAQNRPDIILLDFMMPGMDGLDVMMAMEENERLKALKVIGISATVIDKNRKEKFIEMCVDYLTKPIDIGLLLDCLKHHLDLEWEYEEMTRSEPAPRDPDDAIEKLPPTEVIESLRQEILQGYFTRADRILESLNHGETAYLPFCNRVQSYLRKYDDTGLLRFLDSH